MKKAQTSTPTGADPERIAKVMARAGLCSRREAEAWIAEGRVSVNGAVLETPAYTVKPADVVLVDGQPLPARDRTRLWLFHKPRGLVTTTHDPEGRSTVFDALPEDLPRVMTVGRLDINTEGLLLLTNDGGLARVLELPATGWLRRYRVRAHGEITQEQLDSLRDGVAIDGIFYGAVEAVIDRKQGDNVWLTVGLREGKNREVKNILMHLGLDVNRLIRISFGPFQLGDLADGAVEEVPRRILKDQLGDRLAAEAGADFALREGERQPVQRTLGIAEQARRRPSEAEEHAPEKRGRVARRPEPVAPEPRTRTKPRRPDAAESRRRHEADIEHNAEAREAPNRSRGRLGAKPGAAPSAERKPPRRPASASSELPRAHKSGKAFEVDRKPRATRDEEPAPARGRSGSRPGRDEPPAGRSGRREEAPAGRSGRRDEPPAGRTGKGDDRAGRRPSPDGRPERRSTPAGRDEAPARRSAPPAAGPGEKPGFRSRGMIGARDDKPARARGSLRHGAEPAGPERRPRPSTLDPAARGGRGYAPSTDAVREEDWARGEERRAPRAGRPDRPARGDDRPARPRADDRAERPARTRPDARAERPAGAARPPRSGDRPDRPAGKPRPVEPRGRADSPGRAARDDRPARPRADDRAERPARARPDARAERPAGAARPPRSGDRPDRPTGKPRPVEPRSRAESPGHAARDDRPARSPDRPGGKPGRGPDKPRPGGGKPGRPHADRRR